MNFFQELNERFPNADLTIRIKAKGNTVSVSVLPNSKTKIDIEPIIVTGAAVELDEQLIELIAPVLAETKAKIINLEEHNESLEVQKAAPKATPIKNAERPGVKKNAEKVEVKKLAEVSLFEGDEEITE